jgi:hypothetical protein
LSRMAVRCSSPAVLGFHAARAAIVALVLVSCSTRAEETFQPKALFQVSTPSAPAIQTETPTAGRSGTADGDPWLELMRKGPFPYSTPLPPALATVLDGTFVKREPQVGTPVPCRRCPDYLPEGGLWKLNLDKGVFRIFHPDSGWRSLGSFTVSGNRFAVFNDPACIDQIGLYEWMLEEGELAFKLIRDACQVDRRARSFARRAWEACQPPSTGGATTDHWPVPAACTGGD